MFEIADESIEESVSVAVAMAADEMEVAVPGMAAPRVREQFEGVMERLMRAVLLGKPVIVDGEVLAHELPALLTQPVGPAKPGFA